MRPDRIIWNGKLTEPHEAGIDTGRLLLSAYIYQHIHVYRLEPIGAELHLEIAERALETVYGVRSALSAAELRRDIRELLTANRYHTPSCAVTLMLFPHHPDDPLSAPAYMIGNCTQLFYPRYRVWHTRPALCIWPCDYPHMGVPTSLSWQIALAGREYARRYGSLNGYGSENHETGNRNTFGREEAENQSDAGTGHEVKTGTGVGSMQTADDSARVTVIQPTSGVLTNIEGEPLFVAKGREVCTTPLSDGGADSVMRRTIFETCPQIGLRIRETPLEREMLTTADEIFTAIPQGILSILECEGRSYFNLIAHKLCDRANKNIFSQ